MNDEMKFGESNGCCQLCDKVKEALFFGDELDEEMKKHLDECEDCRTFPEQSLAVEKALSDMGNGAFVRDGVSVADAVMNEIKQQVVFTGGTPLKKKNPFRHGGLVAACIIVAVMAVPVINGMFSDKGSDTVYQSVNDAAPFAESERFYGDGNAFAEESASEITLYSDDEYDGAEVVYDTSTADYSAELKSEPQENGGLAVTGSSGGAKFAAPPKQKAQGSSEKAKTTSDEATNNSVLMSSARGEETGEADIESIALEKAKEILGEGIGNIVFSETHYTDSINAQVYFEFDSGIAVTVFFENVNGEWLPTEYKSEQNK